MYFGKGTPHQFIHQYTYDGDNRLTEVATSTNDIDWRNEATYVYYPHGPLAKIIVAEDIQEEDYYYTLEGWIKGVNIGNNEQQAGTPTDAFAYVLGYYATDYQPISGSLKAEMQTTVNTSNALYNGNIAQMITQLPTGGIQAEEIPIPTTYQTQTVNYHYDQLNRIKLASTSSVDTLGYYTYDANGNLQNLQRFTPQNEALHNLSYMYQSGTNRLTSVSNAVSNVPDTTYQAFVSQDPNNYQYDKIGNLIADVSELTRITWNLQGKVSKVEQYTNVSNFNAQSNPKKTVIYRYDANGNRISKVIEGATSSKYVYIRDASGTTMGIAKNDQITEIPIYGSKRLGQFEPRNTHAPSTIGVHHRRYEFSNHLGNVLVTLNDLGNVLSYSDYYPFGLSINDRSWSEGGYRYGFNGKENDTDLSSSQLIQDYGFRVYNPVIGKFLSVDPLTKEYPWFTPYQFVGNTPIQAIDLDGLENYHYTRMGNRRAGTNHIVLTGVTDINGPEIHRVTNHERRFFGGQIQYIDVVVDYNNFEEAEEGSILKEMFSWGNFGSAVQATLEIAAEGDNITLPRSRKGQKSLKSNSGRALINSKQRGGKNKRAEKLGYDVFVKENGHPDLSKYRYKPKKLGEKNIVLIEMTGSYEGDFKQANKLAGFDKKPKNFTWHHTEHIVEQNGKIYNVMELIDRKVHNAANHSGGVQDYKHRTGDKKAYK